MITTTIRNADDCKTAGFAKFNSGPHVCVLLDSSNEWPTISVRTFDGQRVTFAFVPAPGQTNGRMQCVDICNHDGPRIPGLDRHLPAQHVVVLGAGPTLAKITPEDAATVTSVILT